MDKALFPANLSSLYDMLFWIKAHSKSVGIKDSELKKIELASEEVLVNIIKHAYKDQKGQIEIQFSKDLKEIKLVFKDKGSYFNPLLQSSKLDIHAPLEERTEGGLGILMIKKYMDQVHYTREDPYNILTLVKKFTDFSQ